MTESKELTVVEKAVSVTFGSYKDQIKELKDEGLKTVFNYEDPKGNKEARSFVYKYRQMKSAIAKAHKEGKAQYTKITKAFDAEKTELISECDVVIDFHMAPIEEATAKIEAAEAAEKLAKEQAEWDAAVIADYAQAFDDATAQDDLFNRERVIRLKEEEMARKEAEEAARLQKIEDDRIAKEKAEAEAEKARVETETAAKEKAEREERLKAEAAAKAKAEAEAKAKAERDRIEAEKQAEIDRLNSIEQERLAEEGRKLAEQKRKDEDKEHRFNVKKSILETMYAIGLDEEKSKEFIRLVASGDIDFISITY